MSSKSKTAIYTAIGRRKTATARVRLTSGENGFVVNDRVVEEYFSGEAEKNNYLKPFEVTNTKDSYKVEVKVDGGGASAQVGAVAHGIARALLKVNPQFRADLKKNGLLTRDARMKESRKYGRAGKARALKSSPKR
jgi:small subunit ribosomal protein S9